MVENSRGSIETLGEREAVWCLSGTGKAHRGPGPCVWYGHTDSLWTRLALTVRHVALAWAPDENLTDGPGILFDTKLLVLQFHEKIPNPWIQDYDYFNVENLRNTQRDQKGKKKIIVSLLGSSLRLHSFLDISLAGILLGSGCVLSKIQVTSIWEY